MIPNEETRLEKSQHSLGQKMLNQSSNLNSKSNDATNEKFPSDQMLLKKKPDSKNLSSKGKNS